jgi:hypothetical protein
MTSYWVWKVLKSKLVDGRNGMSLMAAAVSAGIQPILSVAFVTFLILSANTTQIVASTPASNIGNTISFPISKGYVKGNMAYFIATDASDNQTATSITENLGYNVNYAPSLSLVTESAQQPGYEFLNGIKGEGAFGFQLGVANALPQDKGYSPIIQLNFVRWYDNATARELKSAQDILSAESTGELEITKTDILINSPAVL